MSTRMVQRTAITAGYAIVHHANLQNLSKTLGCRMETTSKELQQQLATGVLNHQNILTGRMSVILGLRQIKPNWDDTFEELADIESELKKSFQTDSSLLEDDAIGQLSFQHPLLKPLNVIPWIVTLIALFKIWAVPAMAILTPLLAWILPYLLLKFVYSLPIDKQEYGKILHSMWSGQILSPFEGPGVESSSLWTPRSIGQMFIFGFSFIQSLVQPIQNALHLYRIDSVIYRLGTKILRLRTMIRHLRHELGPLNGRQTKLSHILDSVPESDPRAVYMLIKEQPERLQIVFRDLARLEILYRIAQNGDLTLTHFGNEYDGLRLEGIYDLSLSGKEQIRSSLDLSGADTRTHAVITGPNGGGKSSYLRAILQSVLLGHAYGVAPATYALIPRFSWIASGLQLRDSPGVLSMFETEVKFASECLANRKGPGLVLFDELFHSTNPPDGIRTAEEFLKQLWSRTNVYSIVSTHVFSLVESAPSNVIAMCCPAERTPEGDIRYSYKAQPGICRVSSVDKVWEKFGLRRARPTPASQTLPAKEK